MKGKESSAGGVAQCGPGSTLRHAPFRGQGYLAQPEILPGVSMIKKNFQDRHSQVDVGVWSGLGKEGKNRRRKMVN